MPERSVRTVAIIGAGPAGLMAAEVCAQGGVDVHIYDSMASMGRKFLLAGLGGLNLTHSEPATVFASRYAEDAQQVSPWLQAFDATALRAWAHALGIQTFVGSSGRVFPAEMKAAPLLRAWVARLRQSGVTFHMRHRLLRLSADRTLSFDVQGEPRTIHADAVVLACGGASWPRLGSDGAWVPWLSALGVEVAPLESANCGFDVSWSEHFIERHRGEPVKNVRAWVLAGEAAGATDLTDAQGRAGEMMISRQGVEGGLVYACSRAIRHAQQQGAATLVVDLLPNHDAQRVQHALARGRGAKSWSSHLASALGLKGVHAALLRECAPSDAWDDLSILAASIKRLPIPMGKPRPIEEVISTAGGVRFDALDEHLQCRALERVFCAGEMIDWEAPTGGYLLTAVMASGRVAGEGVLTTLRECAGRSRITQG